MNAGEYMINQSICEDLLLVGGRTIPFERSRERVVVNLQFGDHLVLKGRDGNERCPLEYERIYMRKTTIVVIVFLDDVQTRPVFVHGVQDELESKKIKLIYLFIHIYFLNKQLFI